MQFYSFDSRFSSSGRFSQIYTEEASSVSADLETSAQFTTYKNVKSAMYRRQGRSFSPLPATHQQLEIPLHWRATMSGSKFLSYNNQFYLNILSEWMSTIYGFIAGKLAPFVYCLTVRKDIAAYCEIVNNLMLKEAVLGVVLQALTIICDFETALIPAVQGSFPGAYIQGCYFHFCQAVLRRVTDLGMRTRYIYEAAIKKTVKMLLATAFFSLHDVPAAVELLGRKVTGPVAALFNYFREEWMIPNRLPL
ncbi:hypothetical protein T10_2445 [Trichinella papuae]|uniref:Uncharacterized protein n=1 Tax=Trichinella papuae TaxID=268474 RepID=A0A0V1MK95_9BILA|nr:hypothetical protein T10_2445 [Trichinella papuae]